MDLQAAEKQVKEWAVGNSYSLGLNGSTIEAKYIWNPGGFVNQSYRLFDGVTARHVKLSPDRKAPQLKQWAMISEHLTQNYHAPRFIGEVTQEIIPGYSYGLVFDFIQGDPPSSISNPNPVIEKVLRALNQLHTDRKIENAIASKAEDQSYSEAFIEEYITRFEEDMQAIRSEKHLLNSFVSEDAIEWFDFEIDALKQSVNQNPSFQKKATDVVHNDINWQNILLDDSGGFWIIDWDDLAAFGDAAMDYSVLLWPLYNSKDWPFWKNQIIGLAGDETYHRMEVYFRAKLLDDVIDVLADYIDAENIPELKDKTQKRAKEIHLRAYSEYLRTYVR